ncbi:TRAP transporter large permease subunit [Chloroflexota bacterium]
MREWLITWLSRTAAIFDKSSHLDRWVNGIGAGVLFAITVFTFFNVFMRYFLNRPVAIGYDLTEMSLVIVVLCGIAYTHLHKGHVSIDLVTQRLSEKSLPIINSVVNLLSIGLLSLMIWHSVRYALYAKDAGLEYAILGFPIYPIAFVVPLGCTLFCLLFIRDFLNTLVESLKQHLGFGSWLSLLGALVLAAAGIVVWLQTSPWAIAPSIMGIIGIAVCLLLFAIGMPVGLVLALVGFLSIVSILGLDNGFTILGTVAYRSTADFKWAVVPFFMLLGYFCFFSGVGKDIYYTANKWLGRLHGGLGIATVGASTLFAAVVGDSLSSTATMGTVALPEMRKYKYADTLSTGCIASGGTLGPLIPPSIGFIIYGILTEQSIGALFIAGILPGILVAVSFMLYIYFRCVRTPAMGPRAAVSSFREKLASLKYTWPILLLFVTVIGGIYGGLFTPTEGGGFGAMMALIIGLILKRFTWQLFINALIETSKLIGMAFLILIGAMIFSQFLAMSRLPMMTADFVAGLAVPPAITMVVILLLLLVLGCFLSVIVMLVLTVPIFFPVVTAIGYDPIWFGVIMVLMIDIGTITPPYGINVFVLKGVARDIPMSTMFRGVMPFVVVSLVCVALIVIFPQIATWLPQVLK